MDKIKVAILDDYQNVTHKFGNWKSIEDKTELSIFNKYIGKQTVIMDMKGLSLWPR